MADLSLDRYVLKSNEMYLALRIDEAIYLRGAIKQALKNMKVGDEREFVTKVYDRLDAAVLDLQSYNTKVF